MVNYFENIIMTIIIHSNSSKTLKDIGYSLNNSFSANILTLHLVLEGQFSQELFLFIIHLLTLTKLLRWLTLLQMNADVALSML